MHAGAWGAPWWLWVMFHPIETVQSILRWMLGIK